MTAFDGNVRSWKGCKHSAGTMCLVYLGNWKTFAIVQYIGICTLSPSLPAMLDSDLHNLCGPLCTLQDARMSLETNRRGDSHIARSTRYGTFNMVWSKRWQAKPMPRDHV